MIVTDYLLLPTRKSRPDQYTDKLIEIYPVSLLMIEIIEYDIRQSNPIRNNLLQSPPRHIFIIGQCSEFVIEFPHVLKVP